MIERRLASTLLCLLLVACGPGKEVSDASGTQSAHASGRGRPQTVSAGLTRSESVPIILQAQGYVTAQDEVDIRPQKNGLISAVHVREGEEVRKGQRLFSLDSRNDEANVKKAEATLLSSKAQLATDLRILERNKDLAAKGFISPTALDQLQNKVDTGLAAIAQAEAALASARVLRSYDDVTAPFNGRIGTINVRPGSMTSTSTTAPALVKLTRIHPITVNFTLPESQLSALRTAMASDSAEIRINLPENKSARGKVIFIENNVDRTSGTIAVKAEVDNREHLLWPGQYAEVRVLAGMIENAVTLPAQAVLNTPNGRIVYVIGKDQTVKPQRVELVQIHEQRAIVTGIASGVRVVLEGGQNLRPGSRISEASNPAERERRSQSKTTSSATQPLVQPQ